MTSPTSTLSESSVRPRWRRASAAVDFSCAGAGDGDSLVSVDGGAMQIDPRFVEPLARLGVRSLNDVMSNTPGQPLRCMAHRENWYLQLDCAPRFSRGLYLKKHRIRTLVSRVRAAFGLPAGRGTGPQEAENVLALTRAGVDVMYVVGYGQRQLPGGWQESFILTEDLEAYCPMHDFVRNRFAAEAPAQTGRRDHDLLRLVHQVAALTATMHRAGYTHRDLYFCHYFVREPATGPFDVRLIDLHRAQYRPRFRRHRWIVKDLAQLAWSAPSDRIKSTHKMAFVRAYLGVKKLRPCDKRLIRAVLAKQQVMQRRLGADP